MRIWLLTSELAGELTGGIARYVDNYSRALGAAGHEVTVIARSEKMDGTRQVAPGVTVVPIRSRYRLMSEAPLPSEPDKHPAFPYNLLSYWPAFGYQMAEEVLRLLDTEAQPDVIETQDYAAIAYFLLQRKLTEQTKLIGIPIIVHLHGPWFELAQANQEPRFRFPHYWVGQMEKFCILAADGLVAPSHFLAQRIRNSLGDRELDIRVVPLPCAVTESLASLTPRSKELLYIGRLEVRKGVIPLVEACAGLWNAGKNFSLSLVGEDVAYYPLDTTVGEHIKQRYWKWIDSGRLRMIASVGHTEVLAMMRQAWAVVVPSIWENFPNVCAEAMALGCVVVASRAGGQAELIGMGEEVGVLFDWTCPGDCERALNVVLDMTLEDLVSLGSRARERVAALCDADRVLPQRLAHYRDVIEQHVRRRQFPTIGPQRHPLVVLNACADEQSGLLSVVVPYYNLGKYLKDTISSVLASTYRPLEVVIVDDGSNEPESLAALEELTRLGRSEIRIERTPNQGLATARNLGARMARGEFLAFVDADDQVEPEFFARAVPVLQQYENVGFVYAWVRYFDNDSGCWPTWNAEFPYMLGHNMLVAMVVTRRAAFLTFGTNEPAFEYNFEDYEGWMKLNAAGLLGVSLPHLLIRYRVRPDSMYRKAKRDQQLYLYDLLVRLHRDEYKEYGPELFNLQNANGPAYLWNQPAAEAQDPPAAYVQELGLQRDRLWAEVQTLGRAWEEHVRYINAQRDYIASLETQVAEMLTQVRQRDDSGRVAGGITDRDFQIGGRLVARLKRTRAVRPLLRNTWIKKRVKEWLGL